MSRREQLAGLTVPSPGPPSLRALEGLENVPALKRRAIFVCPSGQGYCTTPYGFNLTIGACPGRLAPMIPGF